MVESNGSGTCAGPEPHVYADNGVYTVTVTVTDDDGGADSDTASATIANVAPSITDVSVIPNPIDEGATTLVTITATDPGIGGHAHLRVRL